MDTKRASVAVIGGSLVGPATELLLRRAGFEDVTTYDLLAHGHSQSGGVMGLRDEPAGALTRVGVDVRAAEALRDRNVYSYDVAPGGVTPRGASPFPGMVTSWDSLHAELGRLVDVRRKHRLTSLAPAGRDGWVLTFANGAQRAADAVVFADGRKSTGRDLLDPGRRLRYAGYVTWRGLGDTPACATPAPLGFTRMYDARHGRLFSVTEARADNGRTYWELSHNVPRGLYAELAGGMPEERAYILPGKLSALGREVVARAARHIPAPYAEMVAASEVAGIPVNDTAMPERAVFWSGGRRGEGAPAVLLGDALVPVRLQVGAGLNQGLAQARELALALADEDPAEALLAWEDRLLYRLGPWVELGRSRAHRTNLGDYEPVVPGRTAVPADGVWSDPRWVTA